MKSIEERLKEHWLRDKVVLNSGASDQELKSFESRYQVKLPLDLRNYFSSVNGMKEDQTDKELIRFWPIEEVVSLGEYHKDSSYLPDANSLFIFADWSIEAHLYAIHLGKGDSIVNQVYVMGQHQRAMQQVSESFTDFASQYLTDVMQVWPKKDT